MNNQGGGLPQGNPILEYYNNWSASTPFITRSACMAVAALYLLSWVIDLSQALSNVPYYSINHLEVYRLIFSPLYTTSLLSVVFIMMSFSGTGRQLEQAFGSASLLALMFTISVGTNVAFVVLCFLLAALGTPEAMFYSCGTFWIIFMGLVVIESMNSGMESRKLLFLPVQIPIKFYPLALYGFFMLFTGFRLDTLLALGIGYLYAWGYLKFLEPSRSRLEGWEVGCLSGMVQRVGFITSSSAVGATAWLPVNNPSGHPSGGGGGGGGGGGLAGLLAGLGGGGGRQQPPQPGGGQAMAEPGAGPYAGGGGPTGAVRPGRNAGADKKAGSAFAGQGMTLGGGGGGGGARSSGRRYAAVPTEDPEAARRARLAALEARGVGGSAVEAQSVQASAPPMSIDEGVMTLQSMGFDPVASRTALENADGNVEQAIELLQGA